MIWKMGSLTRQTLDENLGVLVYFFVLHKALRLKTGTESTSIIKIKTSLMAMDLGIPYTLLIPTSSSRLTLISICRLEIPVGEHRILKSDSVFGIIEETSHTPSQFENYFALK